MQIVRSRHDGSWDFPPAIWRPFQVSWYRRIPPTARADISIIAVRSYSKGPKASWLRTRAEITFCGEERKKAGTIFAWVDIQIVSYVKIIFFNVKIEEGACEKERAY